MTFKTSGAHVYLKSIIWIYIVRSGNSDMYGLDSIQVEGRTNDEGHNIMRVL